MVTVNTESLAETVDVVNDAFFYQPVLTKSERKEVARWLAEMRGKRGSYLKMFAPTSSDRTDGVKVFTGETVRSGAAIGHILGEETCRPQLLFAEMLRQPVRLHR